MIMTAEQTYLQSLTQLAFHNALILSLLGLQFMLPVTFIILLVLIPTLIGLQVYKASRYLIFLSGCLLIFFAFVLFGAAIGMWCLIYWSIGAILGLSIQGKWPWLLRIMSSSLSFMLMLALIMISFAWIAQINWPDVQQAFLQVPFVDINQLIPIGVLGLGGAGLILGAMVDRFLNYLLRQIDFTA